MRALDAGVYMVRCALLPARGRRRRRTRWRPSDACGVQVDGWTGRLDAMAEKAGKTLADDYSARSSTDTLQAEAGPASIYWHPSHGASGRYTVAATFIASASASDEETYGIFMGGSDLDGRVPNHLYCILTGRAEVSDQAPASR